MQFILVVEKEQQILEYCEKFQWKRRGTEKKTKLKKKIKLILQTIYCIYYSETNMINIMWK
jgi:hypothetical protein